METDLALALAASREFLLRQIRGLSFEDCAAKPRGALRSIEEIVEHMLANDAFCMAKLDAEPFEDEPDQSAAARLTRSGMALTQVIRQKWAGNEHAALLRLAGGGAGIARGVAYIQIEDFYHAGQVCWIRLVLHPDWDSDEATYEPFP